MEGVDGRAGGEAQEEEGGEGRAGGQGGGRMNSFMWIVWIVGDVLVDNGGNDPDTLLNHVQPPVDTNYCFTN